MRILQIVSSLEEISGPARSLALLAEGLTLHGHEVTCCHFIGKEGPLVGRLTQQGISVVNLSGRACDMPRLRRAQLIVKLLALVIARGIEVIHAHHFDADCFAVFCKRVRSPRVIVTPHSRSYCRWIAKRRGLYRRVVIPRVDTFASISRSFAIELQRRGQIPAKKIVCIPNSPSPEYFFDTDAAARAAIRQEFGVRDDEVLLGSVGNLTKFKGIDYLLPALASLKGKKIKYLHVGAHLGFKARHVKATVSELGLVNHVLFAGFRQDIPQILDALDIFVFPSIEEVDPISLSEAMAKGKPVIATRIGGIPEKIRDQENGILVAPRDSRALVEALVFLLDRPDERRRMSATARDTMCRQYSFDAMIRSYEEIYARV